MDNKFTIDSRYGYGDVRPQAIETYRKLFEICEKAIASINYDEINQRKIYSVGFLIKAMNTFKALYNLGEYRLTAEMLILLRHLFEIIVLLRANLDDESFAAKYMKTHEARQKKIGNVMKQHPELFQDENLIELKGMLQSLAEEVNTESIPEIKIEELSKRVGMNAYYQLVYRYLCDVAHVSPKTIEHLIKSGTEKPIVISFFPYEEDMTMFLLVACDLMLIALKETDRTFSLSLSEALFEIEQRLELERVALNEGDSSSK